MSLGHTAELAGERWGGLRVGQREWLGYLMESSAARRKAVDSQAPCSCEAADWIAVALETDRIDYVILDLTTISS